MAVSLLSPRDWAPCALGPCLPLKVGEPGLPASIPVPAHVLLGGLIWIRPEALSAAQLVACIPGELQASGSLPSALPTSAINSAERSQTARAPQFSN